MNGPFDTTMIVVTLVVFVVFFLFDLWIFFKVVGLIKRIFQQEQISNGEDVNEGHIVIRKRRTTILAKLAYFVSGMAFVLNGLSFAVIFCTAGFFYNMMKKTAPDRILGTLRFLLIDMMACYMGSQLISFFGLDDQMSAYIKTILFVVCFILYIAFIIFGIKNNGRHLFKVLLEGGGDMLQNYEHPCTGQCEDPDIILNKSPTPRYKHNCRAPCAFATRSGRYYKGKRRIQT